METIATLHSLEVSHKFKGYQIFKEQPNFSIIKKGNKCFSPWSCSPQNTPNQNPPLFNMN